MTDLIQASQPIDTSLFVNGETTTHFTVEAVINAPVELVYRAWTDGDAFKAAYGPEREELRADIDLTIGGRYEWLWDGVIGSNGCQVLSFIPGRMVSFSWNAPPTEPESRTLRTWVVVEFSPTEDRPIGDSATEDGGTHIRLTHLGIGEAEHWQETRAYFQDMAWPHVLQQFRQNLASESD